MKKVQLLLATLLLAIIPFSSYGYQGVQGDVNSDGTVNITDVNAIISIILDGKPLMADADVNNDGVVNISDVNAVISIIIDGPKDQTVVHVYGDDGPSEGSVINVTEATVTVTCDPGEEPKIGDIIVSGITQAAPYGFLRQVMSVQSLDGQCVMTTTNASLEDVLPDGDFDLPIPLDEHRQGVTIKAPGMAPQRLGFSADLKVCVKISWSDGQPIVKLINDVTSAEEEEVLSGQEDTTYPVKFIVNMHPSLDVNFICKMRDNQIESIGLKGNVDISAELMGKISNEKALHLLGDDGIELFSLYISPVSVMARDVPLVFAPHFDVFMKVDCNGEVYLQSKFVATKAEGAFSYIYTTSPDPVTGENSSLTTSIACNSQGDNLLTERMQLAFAPKLGVNGSLTATLLPTLGVSLYGVHDIFQADVTFNHWVNADGNLALTLGEDMELDYDDILLIKSGMGIGLLSNFKLTRNDISVEKDITLQDEQLLDSIGITPRFDEFMLSPSQNPMPAITSQVGFSMDMTKPAVQLIPDQDYGFTYGFLDEDRRDSWTFLSQKDDYDMGFNQHNLTQHIEANIAASSLEREKTYEVCPYVTILGTNIYKKGINFIIRGEVDPEEYVDLALPSGTLWAIRNVGANSPEDYGDYFAWGETAPKKKYDWDTYKWGYLDNYGVARMTKYGPVDNKKELEPGDDAAYVNWGPLWRMPTPEQLSELKYECEWQWTTINGVNGYLVISSRNGNSLFLPATGTFINSSLIGLGFEAYYWSRSLSGSYPDIAGDLYFDKDYVEMNNTGFQRTCGNSVRAVRVSQ